MIYVEFSLLPLKWGLFSLLLVSFPLKPWGLLLCPGRQRTPQSNALHLPAPLSGAPRAKRPFVPTVRKLKKSPLRFAGIDFRSTVSAHLFRCLQSVLIGDCFQFLLSASWVVFSQASAFRLAHINPRRSTLLSPS